MWGKTDGVFKHPHWYPGLNENASFDDFQVHLYAVESAGCPLPCNATKVHLSVPGSLFCFSLILPDGYERDLVSLQFEERASLFACDAQVVYSNREFEISSGLRTVAAVNSSLERGRNRHGEVANADVFMAVWKDLIKTGMFQHYAWTVKVDPDCVFFPGRLRIILQHHEEQPEGMYLVNCKHGLDKSFEVFSRNAVKAWGRGMSACQTRFDRECNGTCNWSEMILMDTCLSEVIGVPRRAHYGLLASTSCDPVDGWQSCADHSRVGFHPMKDFELYWHCLTTARGPIERMQFK